MPKPTRNPKRPNPRFSRADNIWEEPPSDPLRAYKFHRIKYSPRVDTDGKNTRLDECPFCDRAGKAVVDADSGVYFCRVCGERGNIYTLLRHLALVGARATSEEELGQLAEQSGLPSDAAGEFKRWGVFRHPVTGEWVFPAGIAKEGDDHPVNNLYVWRETAPKRGSVKKRKVMMGTAGLSQQPSIGQYLPLNGTGGEAVFLVEGWRDGISLSHFLRIAVQGGYLTKPFDNLNGVRVIVVPGVQSWQESWNHLTAGRDVVLMFDNDTPIQLNERSGGGHRVGGGALGVIHTLNVLNADTKTLPRRVSALSWSSIRGTPAAGPQDLKQFLGEQYDPGAGNGTDLRDYLTEANA